jgi:hypothetical protein
MPTLKSTAIGLLKDRTFTAAVKALADLLATDAKLRDAIADDYLARLRAKRAPAPKPHSRRRVGPHRSPLPTKAQKAGALAAEKTYATAIFDRQIRGGRRLGDVRIHELRAVAEQAATTAVSFLQRGYDDAVETFLCVMLSKHCVAAEPFTTVEQAIKPSVATAILDKAKVRAAEMLRDGGAKMARELVAAAQIQDLSS